MKVLVTGSNGCVGSALKTICHDWIFIDRKDCDLTDRNTTIKLFSEIRPDYVIHLASYVPGFYAINKVNSFATNVRINENVLEASHLADVDKGMFCLSVNMFSEHPSKFPMDESMIFEGSLGGVFAGYAYSKRMLALQCQNYNEQFGRRYFGLIPSNIYGPNDNYNSGRLIPNLISKFKEAKFREMITGSADVTINGTGQPLRQFIYSIDLAKIIKSLVNEYQDIKPVICCSDEEISIRDLAYEIRNAVKFTGQIRFDVSKPDGSIKKTVSNAYLKSLIDVSFTSLKDGIKEII